MRSFAAATFLLLAAPLTAAADVTYNFGFYDEEFVESQWTHSVLYSYRKPVTGEARLDFAAREASGGVGGAWQHGQQTVYDSFSQIDTGHLFVNGVYDPAIDGAISSIDLTMDVRDATHFSLLVKQNGQHYVYPGVSYYGVGDTDQSWRAFAIRGVTESSAGWKRIDGVFGADPAEAPDFDQPMQFGYHKFVWATNRIGFRFVEEWGVDNFTVTLSVPEPASLCVFAALAVLMPVRSRR